MKTIADLLGGLEEVFCLNVFRNYAREEDVILPVMDWVDREAFGLKKFMACFCNLLPPDQRLMMVSGAFAVIYLLRRVDREFFEDRLSLVDDDCLRDTPEFVDQFGLSLEWILENARSLHLYLCCVERLITENYGEEAGLAAFGGGGAVISILLKGDGDI